MTFAPAFALVLWAALAVAMLVVPEGRRALVRTARDVGRVLGLDRRGPTAARLEDAVDPALRRCAAVKAAYVAGEFGPEELDWRIVLALLPPPTNCEVRARSFPTHTTPWSAAVPATATVPWTAAPAPCRYHELHSGSGYLATICDCGHDMAMHYDGGCNDCDAFRRMDAEPARQFPRPQMQEIGKPPDEPLPTEPDPRLRPPKPSDAARSVRPAARQSHG